MIYYNPVTEEQLSHQELKKRLNASFPAGVETVDEIRTIEVVAKPVEEETPVEPTEQMEETPVEPTEQMEETPIESVEKSTAQVKQADGVWQEDQIQPPATSMPGVPTESLEPEEPTEPEISTITETVGTWYLLHDEYPTLTPTQVYGLGPIELKDGKYYQTRTVVDMDETQLTAVKALRAHEIRVRRDAKLAQTDFLLMPDYPISTEDLAVVKEYRQQLRDIPEQEGFPWPDQDASQIDWPDLNAGTDLRTKLSL